MSIGKFLLEFAITFVITLVVSIIITFLYNLIVHGCACVNWETSLPFAFVMGIVLPLVKVFDKKTKD